MVSMWQNESKGIIAEMLVVVENNDRNGRNDAHDAGGEI